MIELCTGPLTLDEIEGEIGEIADLLRSAGSRMVYVTFGLGCCRERLVEAADIPVATDQLVETLGRFETAGVFRLGEADVTLASDIGRVSFLLCHHHDVHCTGEATRLLGQVRRRWGWQYPASSARQHRGAWRRLQGRRQPRESR